MCIRDRLELAHPAEIGEDLFLSLLTHRTGIEHDDVGVGRVCLLYTSDAADERSSVDLGGRRILKKKQRRTIEERSIRQHTIAGTAET